MIVRDASCACGNIRVRCKGEPVRISVCHCLECQKRTGSAFSAQARFLKENVEFVSGNPRIFERVGDDGGRITQRFCGVCGTTVWHTIDADPAFPPPRVSVYGERKHAWVEIKDLAPVEHIW